MRKYRIGPGQGSGLREGMSGSQPRKKHDIGWLNLCPCPGSRHTAACTAPWGETWNPTRGCSKIDPGCKNCYAIKSAASIVRRAKGKPVGLSYAKCLTKDKSNWSGHLELVPALLSKPLGWKHPRTVFVNSMSDLFHPEVPFEFIAAVFAIMAATPRHKYVILTKRPERALEWFCQYRHCGAFATHFDRYWHHLVEFVDRSLVQRFYGVHAPASFPLPNVTIGVSISDQPTADRLLPLLPQIPAAYLGVSVEPMLGPVDLTPWLRPSHSTPITDTFREEFGVPKVVGWHPARPGIDWVIIGAESGKNRRPCELAWAQDLAGQVLDVQAWENRGMGGIDLTPVHVSGSALHVKQLDVCRACHGRQMLKPDEPCTECGGKRWSDSDWESGAGQTGKLRKGHGYDGTLYVPGHGVGPWRQFPVGWRP